MAHNLAFKNKRQLEYRSPSRTLQKPTENPWQYLLVQLIILSTHSLHLMGRIQVFCSLLAPVAHNSTYTPPALL